MLQETADRDSQTRLQLKFERAWWREMRRISKSILIQFKPVDGP
jgi:hypothetical protein